MRKIVFYIIVVSMALFTVSCKKKKLKEGDYIGNFYGYHLNEDGSQSEFQENELGVSIELSNMTDTSIVVNGNSLTPLIIDGKDSIFGRVPVSPDYYVSPTIKGKYRNFFGKITIEGTYTAFTVSGVNVSGTFEIKSE